MSRADPVVQYYLQLVKSSKIPLPGHFGCSHIRENYVVVYFFIGWNNNRSENPWFYIRTMVPLLSFKHKTVFDKDTFKDFPVNRGYAWHWLEVV
jgi:hypothetical protein